MNNDKKKRGRPAGYAALDQLRVGDHLFKQYASAVGGCGSAISKCVKRHPDRAFKQEQFIAINPATDEVIRIYRITRTK